MRYRNIVTGLEVITDCVVYAPNYELIEDAPKKITKAETPQTETSGESLVLEDKPKKRTKRAKK